MNIFQLFACHSFVWAHSVCRFVFGFFTLSKSVRSPEEKYQATLALNGQFRLFHSYIALRLARFLIWAFLRSEGVAYKHCVFFAEARRGAAN